MTNPNESRNSWIQDHLHSYISTDGKDGHIWRGVPTLLLTTTGRLSGKLHTTPLIYGKFEDKFLIIASRGGAPAHQQWYLNILNTLIKINVDDPNHTIQGHINTLPNLLVRGDKMIVGNENIIKYFNIPPPQNNTQNIEINSNTDNNFNYNPNIDKNLSNDNKNNKSLPPLTDVPFSKQNESMFLNSNELGGNWSDTYSFINNDIIQNQQNCTSEH